MKGLYTANFVIYDNFKMLGYLMGYTTITWHRKFSDVGIFEIQMPFKKSNFELLQPNHVIYHEENKEAGIIENILCYTNAIGEKRMVIQGRSLSSILSRRVAKISNKGTLVKQNITNLLNDNFINPAKINRKIDSFVLGEIELSTNHVKDIEYTSDVEVLTIIKELAQDKNFGFNIDYDFENKKLVFNLLNAVESKVVFSDNYKTVKEQELYVITDIFKNTAKIGESWVNDENKGIDRYEAFASSSTEETIYITAYKLLDNHKKTKSIDGVANSSSNQYEYRKDWDLGTIVTCSNDDWEMEELKNIIEIKEIHEKGYMILNVVYGDSIPNKRT